MKKSKMIVKETVNKTRPKKNEISVKKILLIWPNQSKKNLTKSKDITLKQKYGIYELGFNLNGATPCCKCRMLKCSLMYKYKPNTHL